MSMNKTSGAAALLLAAIGLPGPSLAQDAKPKTAAPVAVGPKAGDTKHPAVAVTAPWARATPGGAKVGAAFLELSAPAGVADKLIAAKSPVAGVVELHTHTHANGVMQMRRIDNLPVGPGAKVVMKPGGHHIMLMELKGPLIEGQPIELTLVFEKAGEVKLSVPVLKVGSPGPAGAAAPAGAHGAHGKH